MDTLDVIREKADRLVDTVSGGGLLAVVRHLEMAEQHFSNGRKSGDSDLFADVVFRANHACEGILRESYGVLTGKDSKGITTYKIEQYFIKNAVFKDRVMEVFQNYREKWRNPSTHDHVLTFSESEAFLAILNVTGLVALLMDEVDERLAFQRKQSSLEAVQSHLREQMNVHADEPLVDRLDFLLGQYAHRASADLESELIGEVSAFLHTVAPKLEVLQEPVVGDASTSMRPDFIVGDGDEKIVLELKRAVHWSDAKEKAALDQMRRCPYFRCPRRHSVRVVPHRDRVPRAIPFRNPRG